MENSDVYVNRLIRRYPGTKIQSGKDSNGCINAPYQSVYVKRIIQSQRKKST